MRRSLLAFVVLVTGLVGGAHSPVLAATEIGAPTQVRAIRGDGVVTLSWTTPEGPVTAWRIWRDDELVTDITDLSAPVYTDAGLVNGRRHRYQVSAVTAAGEGPRSRPVAVTVAPRPEDPEPVESTGAEGGTQSRTFTYSLATRGTITVDFQLFALHVGQTLNDPRGWSLGGSIEFRQVRRGGDFTVVLAQDSTLPSFGSPCSSAWSCRVGRNVIINQTRWRYSTESWVGGGGSLDSYRHYVVNHETGHWLGFGHASCPGGGQAAPVMQQQSKGLDGCHHNTWPVGGERGAAASRHGVGARAIGPGVQHSSFGQRGDEVLVCDWDGNGVETPGVVRDNEWRLRNNLRSGGPQVRFTYGEDGDRYVCGDWDGNGSETVGVVRGNQWLLRNSNRPGPPVYDFHFGTGEARPVVGDWNGDGFDTPGMVEGSHWRVRNQVSAGPPARHFVFGRPHDTPVAGDWDGDGRSDPAMVRRHLWLLRRSLTGGDPDQRVSFGNRGATPLAGHWVGLANDLPARAANGRWHFRRFAPLP